MRRSLVAFTLLLVGGVVLLLGAGVLAWIAAEDLDAARSDADEQQRAAEQELRTLARVLLGLSQDTAQGLVEGSGERLRRWLEQEPLTLYRDAEDPERVDVAAIMRALTATARQGNLDELANLRVLVERMALQGDERIDSAMRALRKASASRANAAAAERSRSLVVRFALLLLGMAILLALTLGVLVVRPVRRLRSAVDRIASGDLLTPVEQPRGGTAELADLAQDVERMRGQMRVATEGLEAEVRRKTETLATTLQERTRALDELRATQERLVQAAKMAGLGTLAGGVAHEFNNLIGGILGCLESARAGSQDEAVLEDLDVAKKTAGRATVLVRALLDVARPGRRDFAPVDLNDVAADVLRAATPTAKGRGIRLAHEAGDAALVLGDEGQLHQVALNLVTNAIQACDDGGCVVVATRTDEGHGVLEVRDDGAGVPPAERDRIFEPFFTGRDDGTGLGLFVSYGIVERHGGRIEVGEAAEGGARFTVSLPGA